MATKINVLTAMAIRGMTASSKDRTPRLWGVGAGVPLNTIAYAVKRNDWLVRNQFRRLGDEVVLVLDLTSHLVVDFGKGRGSSVCIEHRGGANLTAKKTWTYEAKY